MNKSPQSGSLGKYKKINGMMGRAKKFDQKLSDAFDTKSREMIKKLLKDSVDDNPNKYGEDMIVIDKKIPYHYIELQVYGKWSGKYFPHNMPYVYERKMKFSDKTLFVCFNSKYDELIMFCRTSIHPKKYRLKKYSREMICYVPWSRAVRIEIKDFTIESILNYSGIFTDETQSQDQNQAQAQAQDQSQDQNHDQNSGQCDENLDTKNDEKLNL